MDSTLHFWTEWTIFILYIWILCFDFMYLYKCYGSTLDANDLQDQYHKLTEPIIVY